MERARGDGASVRCGASLTSRVCEIEVVSTGTFFEAAADVTTTGAAGSRVVWTAPDGRKIAAWGTAAVLSANGSDRFASVREHAAELFDALAVDANSPYAARPRLFGGFSFYPDVHDSSWAGVPDARFVLPAVQLVPTAEGDSAWLTVTGHDPVIEALARWRDRLAAADSPPARVSPSIEHVRRTTSRAAWYEQVETALSQIDTGSLRKVVLAQALSAVLDAPVSAIEALSELAETYPECVLFAFSPDDGAREFFGATPERLVSVYDRRVETGALAGSIGRGETDTEDERLATALRESEKDDREHELVVEAIRDQLRSVARSVTIGERRVRRLATVQHLYTPIAARLACEEHVLSLVEALHPTPAVGGLPPDTALETIRETEGFDRGWYAAPVGWFDADGDGEFAVAIRSAVADDREATLFAGNGIVAGSDPESEWEEVQLKYRPMLDAIGL